MLVVVVLMFSCKEKCETFTNDVPAELPPNFKKQFYGLLNNTKWVLANDKGDTLIITAEGPYEDAISTTYNAGESSVCDKEYNGERDFTNSTFGSYDKFFRISAYNADKLSIHSNIGLGFEWNLNTDFWEDTADSDIMLLDSINLAGQVYYNVFYQTESSYIFQTEIGFIGSINQSNIEAILIHYE